MNRKYAEHNAPHVILNEVFVDGKSKGWSGNLEDLEYAKQKLSPFNIVYDCDFTGTWILKKAK